MGRIKWPKLVTVVEVEPCPPHTWESVEDSERVFSSYVMRYCMYHCKKCFTLWPSPVQEQGRR